MVRTALELFAGSPMCNGVNHTPTSPYNIFFTHRLTGSPPSQYYKVLHEQDFQEQKTDFKQIQVTIRQHSGSSQNSAYTHNITAAWFSPLIHALHILIIIIHTHNCHNPHSHHAPRRQKIQLLVEKSQLLNIPFPTYKLI